MMNVVVLSPTKSVINTKAASVSLPGVLGRMEILEMHAPLIAELGEGEIKVSRTSESKDYVFFLSGGYVHVLGDDVTVLADVIEESSNLMNENRIK